MNKQVKSLLQDASILVMSNIILKLMNVLLLPLYTSKLTPDMLGVNDTITSFIAFAFPILVMGLDSAFSAFYFKEDDEKRGYKVYSTLKIIFFIMSILSLLISVCAQFISQILFGSNEYTYTIILANISMFFNLNYLVYGLELRIQNKMSLYSRINIFGSALLILFNILFLNYYELGASALIVSSTLSNGILFLIYTKTSIHKFALKNFDRVLLKEMYRFAIPLLPMVISAWLLTSSDRYMILKGYGEFQVGVYGIAIRVLAILNVFVTAVNTAYTTFAYSTKDSENAKWYYVKIFNGMFIVLCLISFSISLFGKEIMYILVDEQYYGAADCLRDLLYSQIFYGLIAIISYGFLFAKKTKYSLMATAAGAVVNIGLNIIMIPKYGITAAAFTTLIGYVVSFILSYHWAQKCNKYNYEIKKMFIVLLISYLCVAIFKDWIIGYRIILWVCIIVLFIVSYRSDFKLVIKSISRR